jgi:hypothetical protein
MTAPCLLKITAGRLPAAVDPDGFDLTIRTPTSSTSPQPSTAATAGNRTDLVQALLDFDWATHPDVLALPQDARSFVLSCLARNRR